MAGTGVGFRHKYTVEENVAFYVKVVRIVAFLMQSIAYIYRA